MYSLRNVEDGQTIALTGGGGGANDGSQEYCVGLTLDESIVCSVRRENRTASGPGNGDPSMDNPHIVVPLVMLTVWKTSGVTVCPASRDLRCRLNGEDVEKESNVIPGSQIEVADKTLELLEGPAPTQRPRPHRRHLPPTPGHPILPSPPPKPQRSHNKEGAPPPPPPIPPREKVTKKDSLKEELKEWCQIQLPNSEHELLDQVKDPDQLASLASSYLTRHINVHTDIAMTADVADRIAKMLQEVAVHRKEILKRFLADVISDTSLSSSNAPTPPSSSPLHSPTQGTQHSTVTSLLVEILRQFLDPQYIVLLCLQLLRALSHVPHNVIPMVRSQTISAVLGSMAVFRDEEEVQNFCLDILAKMATFVPAVLAKPPMRESSIELVVLAMTLHDTSMTVVAASVRVLANLAQSLHSLAFNSMIGPPSPELRVYVLGVLDVLDYLYQQTCHRVRSALADSGQDLNIKMDGRRFLFEYAKMEQLKCQHQLWETQPNSPTRPLTMTTHHNHHHHHHSREELKSKEEFDDEDEDAVDSRYSNEENRDTNGILKKCRSFENLRSPDKKVFFKNENRENEFTSSNSSSSSSDTSSNNIDDGNNVDRSNSPDVQVLSRSIICPSTLSPIPSLSGDETTPTTAPSIAYTNYHHHHHPQFHSSPVPTRPDNHDPATTPPTPNAPPIRRPIQAPLVHINSQSDSEAETTCGNPESPCGHFHKQFEQKLPQEVSFNPDERYAETPCGNPESPCGHFHKQIEQKSPQEVSFNPDERYTETPCGHFHKQIEQKSPQEVSFNPDEHYTETPCGHFHKQIEQKSPQEVSFNPDERYAEIHSLDRYSDSSSGLISDYSVTSSSSSSSSTSRHRHVHQEETTKRLPFHSPISLEGFSYSAADVVYMKRVMSVQITCHICSASIKGSVPPPLKLIDLPLCDLLQRPGIPKAVGQFAHSQFDPKITLMDIDPAIVIAIIDGVRYNGEIPFNYDNSWGDWSVVVDSDHNNWMLAFELLQKTLHALLQRLSPTSVHQKITLVVGELLQSVSVDPSLSPIMEDSDFVRLLQTELDKLKSNGLDPTIVSHLWECLQPVASLTSKEDNVRKE